MIIHPLKIILLILFLSLVSNQLYIYVNSNTGIDPQDYNQNLNACGILTSPLCTMDLPCQSLPCAFEYINSALKLNDAQDVIITLANESNPYTLSNKSYAKQQYWFNIKGSFILKGNNEIELMSNETCLSYPILNLQYLINDPIHIRATNGVIMEYLNVNALLADKSINVYDYGFIMENICITISWPISESYMPPKPSNNDLEEILEYMAISEAAWYKMINLITGIGDFLFTYNAIEANNEEFNWEEYEFEEEYYENADYSFSNIIVMYDAQEFVFCDNVYMVDLYPLCSLYDNAALITHTIEDSEFPLPNLMFSNIIIDCSQYTNYMKFFYSQNSETLMINNITADCFPSFKITSMYDVMITNISLYSSEPYEEYYSDTYENNTARVFDLTVSGSQILIQNVTITDFEVGICYYDERCEVALTQPISIFYINVITYDYNKGGKSSQQNRILDQNELWDNSLEVLKGKFGPQSQVKLERKFEEEGDYSSKEGNSNIVNSKFIIRSHMNDGNSSSGSDNDNDNDGGCCGSNGDSSGNNSSGGCGNSGSSDRIGSNSSGGCGDNGGGSGDSSGSNRNGGSGDNDGSDGDDGNHDKFIAKDYHGKRLLRKHYDDKDTISQINHRRIQEITTGQNNNDTLSSTTNNTASQEEEEFPLFPDSLPDLTKYSDDAQFWNPIQNFEDYESTNEGAYRIIPTIENVNIEDYEVSISLVNITISNNTLRPNPYDTFFSFIYITASQSTFSTLFFLKDILYINNTGINAYQTYGFRLYDADLYILDNINYTQNNLSRLVVMGTLVKQFSSMLIMSNIEIYENIYSLINYESYKFDVFIIDDPSMGIIDFTANNNTGYISLTNISIQNNFLASVTIINIKNSIIIYQFKPLYTFLSSISINYNVMYSGYVIYITGFHTYIDNLNFTFNYLQSSGLLYLGKKDNQFNSFVVQNSTFSDCEMYQSSLLTKNIDLESAIVYLNDLANLTLPFWLTVTNCTFEHLMLFSRSTAIEFDSIPFTFIANNTFNDINIQDGSIMIMGNDFADSLQYLPNPLDSISRISDIEHIDSYTAKIFYNSRDYIISSNVYNELILDNLEQNNYEIFIARIAFNTFDTIYTVLGNVLDFGYSETNMTILSFDNNNVNNVNTSNYIDTFISLESMNIIGLTYNNFVSMGGNGIIMIIIEHTKAQIYRNIFMNNNGSRLLLVDGNSGEMTLFDQNIIKNIYSNFTLVSFPTQCNQGKIIFRNNLFINITIQDYIYTYQALNFISIQISTSTGSLIFDNNTFGNIQFIKNHTLIKQFDNSFMSISNPDDTVRIYRTIFYNISILYDNNLLSVVAKVLNMKYTTLSLIYNYDEWGSLYFLGNFLYISHCNFQYNFAYSGKGGAIYVDNDKVEDTMTLVRINSSYFRNNLALVGSTFYYSGKIIQFTLENCTFYEGPITTLDTQYGFYNNLKWITGVIAIQQAVLYSKSAFNMTIVHSQGNSNGITFLLFDGLTMANNWSEFAIEAFEINIDNDIFSAIEIKNSSDVVFKISTISIKPNNSNFYNVSLLIFDSSIVTIKDLSLTSLIIYSSFIKFICNSKANVVLDIANSTFSNFTIPILRYSFGIIDLSKDGPSHDCLQSLTLLNTTFSSSQIQFVTDWTLDFSAIYSNYVGNMTISLINNTFEYMKSVRGPVINLNNWPIAPSLLNEYLSKLESITNTSNEVKQELQDLYYYYDTSIIISNCIFTNNTSSLEGGSIYNTYNNLSISNTLFAYNQAQYRSGGAIFSSNINTFAYILNKSNNNTFLSNKRYSIKLNGAYSDEAPLGTPPIAMNMTLQQSIDSYAKIINFTTNNSFLISNVTSTELQYITFIIGLIDGLGQIFYESPTGDIELSTLLGNLRVIKMISNVSSTSTSNCDFANCYISDNIFTLKGIAGTLISINFTYQSLENTVPNITITSIVRGCIVGEINSSNIPGGDPIQSFCTICPSKLYSLDLNDSNCNSCNFGDAAYCLGGSNIIVNPGYWRQTNLSDIILKCPNSLSCLGGFNSDCAFGYDGPLCQSCNGTAKFARSGPSICGKCPSKIQQIILTVVFILLVIIHQIYMIRSSLLENLAFYQAKMTPDQEKAKIQGQYIRLLTTYGQIISIVLAFRLEYPSFVSDSVGNLSKSPTDTIFTSTLCFLIDLDYSPNDLIFSQIVLVSALPLVKITIISILLFIILTTCKIKETPDMKKAYFVISIFCVILVEQPSLFINLVSYLTCIQFKNQEKYFLLEDYAVECFTPKYNFYLVLIVIPSLLVWGLLIPAILFIIMYKNKSNLNDKLLRLNLGGIYNEYTDKAYYWGVVLMIMKLMIMFSASLLYNDIKTEALTIFIIIFIYLIAQQKIKPIRREEFQKAEQLSTISYLLTIFFAIYYKDNKYFACQIFAIIIMGCANFFVLGLIIFRLTMLNAKYIPCLKKYLEKQNKAIEIELDQTKRILEPEQPKPISENIMFDGDESKAIIINNLEVTRISYSNRQLSRSNVYYSRTELARA